MGRVYKWSSPWVFWLRLIIFWVALFAVFRLWMLVQYTDLWPAGQRWSVVSAFWYALSLDGSTIGYLIAIPLIIWLPGIFLPLRYRHIAEIAIEKFNQLVIIPVILLFGANIFLYREWNTLLNRRAIAYLKTPEALLNSMSVGLLLLCVVLAFGGIALGWWSYRKVVGRTLYPSGSTRWQVLWWPIWVGLCALAIRGGTGPMPINESVVYRSPHLFINHAATNTLWHLIHSMIESRATTNPFKTTDDAAAKRSTAALFTGTNALSPVHILRDSTPPNIVFIIMEGMTAQVVADLGGEPGICPNLSRIIEQGILFDSCYSSGYRTDQGFAAVLAGYPAQPDQSVILLDDKANKLPSMYKVMREQGYTTLYSCGIGLNFGNFGVWLRTQGAQQVTSIVDFPKSAVTQNWGVDDYLFLQHFSDELAALPTPFFAVGQTQSQHPPYDTPDWFNSAWKNSRTDGDLFRYAAAFADHALGEFFKKAAAQTWYKNTLFVLVADHGHSLPAGTGTDNPIARRMPFILAGPVLQPAWQGKRVHLIGNHHDIPSTVLQGVLHQKAPFAWSRNLFDRTNKGFAYFSNENCLGWITPRGQATYFFNTGAWRTWNGTVTTDEQQEAQAYLQTLYNDFLSL